MLTVAHVTAGAAIGSFLPDSVPGNVAALGLGIASHYVLDTIPHWENWFGREIYGFPSGTPLGRLPAITIIGGICDFVLALVLFTFLYQKVGSGLFYHSSLFWGALGGFLPDILDNVPIVSDWLGKIPGVSAERSFHSKIHISEEAPRRVPYLIGLVTQLVVIIFGLYLVLR